MRRRIRPLTAGAAAFGIALALVVAFTLSGRSQDESPANAAALARVAEKNGDAALRAAARMRADSQRATAAVEAQTSAETASAERP